MRASSSTRVRAARPGSVRSRVTAASSARTLISCARRSKPARTVAELAEAPEEARHADARPGESGRQDGEDVRRHARAAGVAAGRRERRMLSDPGCGLSQPDGCELLHLRLRVLPCADARARRGSRRARAVGRSPTGCRRDPREASTSASRSTAPRRRGRS